jgi:hypothetical protein
VLKKPISKEAQVMRAFSTLDIKLASFLNLLSLLGLPGEIRVRVQAAEALFFAAC